MLAQLGNSNKDWFTGGVWFALVLLCLLIMIRVVVWHLRHYCILGWWNMIASPFLNFCDLWTKITTIFLNITYIHRKVQNFKLNGLVQKGIHQVNNIKNCKKFFVWVHIILDRGSRSYSSAIITLYGHANHSAYEWQLSVAKLLLVATR